MNVFLAFIIMHYLFIIIFVLLGAVKCILLIKCLVPIYKISNEALKLILTWCLSSLDDLQITIVIIIMQWVVGTVKNILAFIKLQVYDIISSILFQVCGNMVLPIRKSLECIMMYFTIGYSKKKDWYCHFLLFNNCDLHFIN